jgi:tryptophanyl-tRNA synthetase
MSIITDNAPINEPKNKETPLFRLYCLFADKSEQQILSEKYDSPGLRYGDVKLELYEKIMDYFSPYRKERAMLQSKPDYIKDILILGAKKAKDVALEVLDKVRSNVGLSLNL